MRRVVVNGRFFAQQRTGVQRYGVETLRALDRLLSRWPQYLQGTRWQLAIPRDAADLPLLENFEIHQLQFLRGHLWEQFSLALFARGAYLVNPSYSGPLGKRDQLITVHDAAVRAYPQMFSRSYRMINQLMMSVLAPRVETLMTVSRFSANELRRHFRLARNDAVVGREGWEHAVESPAADEGAVLRRHGLHSAGFLLTVGSAKANKNFGLVAQAVRLLGDEQRLPVVVAGAFDARLYQSAPSTGDRSLRWLGFVPDAELGVLYRHAAWLIFPSLYEGFGLPPLEAMAHGCPVLAAHAASTSEIYGGAVLYFDPSDPASLAQLLREISVDSVATARRDGLKQHMRACLASQSWRINAEIILERLLAAGAVAAPPAESLRAATQRLEPLLPFTRP
jgi:glycosyltransferase involved in cell wall biosynthesis